MLRGRNVKGRRVADGLLGERKQEIKRAAGHRKRKALETKGSKAVPETSPHG